MTVRTILHLGDPRLYVVAKPVDNITAPAIKNIITDMYDTMSAYQGAGLAAPQINIPLQIMIFGAKTPRYAASTEVPETVLINPKITYYSEETDGYWESCLSTPNLRGLVERPSSIRYEGYDPSGNLIQREATGFHARSVQHEMDHLNGTLFTCRIKDNRLLAFENEAGYQALKQQVETGAFRTNSREA